MTGMRGMRLGAALAGLAAAGLAWRLSVALGAPWFWDEGYVVEIVRGLAHFSRPQAGGFWQDGFFPLTTSLLAPLSAMPLAVFPFWSPMTGARVWAVLLEGAALLLLARLARKEERPALALAAVAAYAFLPFAVEHGGRAFYHHLGAALMLAALALGQRIFDEDARGSWVAASLCAGLAAASCYWLWWLPLSWGVLLAARRPAGWLGALPWAALPLPAALALNFWPDAEGARWSLRCMAMVSHAGGPRSLEALGGTLAANFGALPFLALGLLGLGVAAAREGGRWGWFLFCLGAAIGEPIRQRGDLSDMPYPFIMAAPLAALGAGYLAAWGWPGGARARWALAALVLAVFLRPVKLERMRVWSFYPAEVGGLQAFLEADSRPGDLACGLPHFNWALKPRLRVCEPSELAAAEGRAASCYLEGAPPSRFDGPARLEDLRYAVVSRLHLLWLFRMPGITLSFLDMERRGWPLVYDSPVFKVYENPRFGRRADPQVRILKAGRYYALAQAEALRRGDKGLERFAAARLKP
jgi:hypothetical protein